MAAIAVRKRLNGDEPVVEAHCDFVHRVGQVANIGSLSDATQIEA
jgi:carbamate kinase